MSGLDLATSACLAASAFFYLGGTAGLLRFPDIFARLHAPAKADNVGLGFLILGLALQAESLAVALKLASIWIFTLIMAGCTAYLVARQALVRGGEDGDDRGRGSGG